jgi:hypothetical protein
VARLGVQVRVLLDFKIDLRGLATTPLMGYNYSMEIYWDILGIIKKRSLGKLGSRSQLCKWLKQVETS